MNEILLYKTITSQTAEEFIQTLNWISPDSAYSVRMYTMGGDVQAAWGMWAKINELKISGCRSIAKVDGMAASMGGYLLCAFDERKALSVSEIMLHRAEVNNENEDGTINTPTESEKESCAKINASLKSRLLEIIDDSKLKAIKGFGVDEMFDDEKERIDCQLTAVEAKEIGLITEIIQLTTANSEIPTRAAALYKQTAVMAISKPNTNTTMTAEEFKKTADYQALVTQAKVEAKKDAEEEAKKAAEEAAKKAKAKAKATKEDDEDDEDDEDAEDEACKAEIEKLKAKKKAIKEDKEMDEDEKTEALGKIEKKEAKVKGKAKEAIAISRGVVLALKEIGLAGFYASGVPQMQTYKASKEEVQTVVEDARKAAEAIMNGKPIK